MKRALVAVAVVLLTLTISAAQDKQQTSPTTVGIVGGGPPLDKYVNKLWEAFKNKDKATLSSLIDDKFRQFEESLSPFANKKTEVNAVDEYDLISYTLSDFTVRPLAPNTALVTYIAQYQGKSGGEDQKAKSVFGEVWTHTGSDWKCLYMQETYVK
jgi:hypothetical protein